MLPLDYASDSEDDDTKAPENSSSVPTINTKSNLTQPTLTNNSSSSGLALALPPPKAKKTAGPKKIKIELLPKAEKRGSDDDDEPEMPAAKKPKLGGKGSGASALLSMLPAPKKSTFELPPPKRVLGGGKPGVVYSAASRATTISDPTLAAAEKPSTLEVEANATGDEERAAAEEESATSLIPPSMLLKGKVKMSTEKPRAPIAPPTPAATTVEAIDFFSLGQTSSTRASTSSYHTTDAISTATIPPPVSISAAPVVEEFRPPSPKVDDPYPGYYQLPSGTWAAHDPEYYRTYSNRWAKEYEAQIRAFEKTQRGFEGAGIGGEDAEEVSGADLQDAARAAQEEKKSLTTGARLEGERALPKVSLNPSKTGNLARTRHQLHSLLADAYMNREALEDKIAQGRRNRKEAGNKYGF